jgi:hypothetical protein
MSRFINSRQKPGGMVRARVVEWWSGGKEIRKEAVTGRWGDAEMMENEKTQGTEERS